RRARSVVAHARRAGGGGARRGGPRPQATRPQGAPSDHSTPLVGGPAPVPRSGSRPAGTLHRRPPRRRSPRRLVHLSRLREERARAVQAHRAGPRLVSTPDQATDRSVSRGLVASGRVAGERAGAAAGAPAGRGGRPPPRGAP